jgi:hypothetical protein
METAGTVGSIGKFGKGIINANALANQGKSLRAMPSPRTQSPTSVVTQPNLQGLQRGSQPAMQQGIQRLPQTQLPKKGQVQPKIETLPVRENPSYNTSSTNLPQEAMKIYRAGEKPFDPRLVREDGYTPGVYFANNKKLAQEYSDNGKRIVEEFQLAPDAKVLRYEDLPAELKKSPKLTNNTKYESAKNIQIRKREWIRRRILRGCEIRRKRKSRDNSHQSESYQTERPIQ